MTVRKLLIALAISAIGTAYAGGSFSVVIAPLDLYADINIEQEVTTIEGWTVYAGSGFAIDTTGVRKLQPYTLICSGLDIYFAAAEWCAELRAPLVGNGSILRLFVSAVW